MDDREREAFVNLAQDISSAFDRFAAVLAGGTSTPRRTAPSTDLTSEGFTPASMSLPWAERTLRQSLIIDEIVKCGGNVSRAEWYEIAAKYGYSGRGLAGFFRKDKNGLLEMRGEKVHVTAHGRQRLRANMPRIEAHRAAQAA